MERIILNADPKMVYTNGKVAGSTVFLAVGESAENYEQVMEDVIVSMLENQPTAEDYQSALAELGVKV